MYDGYMSFRVHHAAVLHRHQIPVTYQMRSIDRDPGKRLLKTGMIVPQLQVMQSRAAVPGAGKRCVAETR